MKNAEAWQPTKFVERDGRWRSSHNSQHLSPTSVLIADLQVTAYARMIRDHARGDLLDLGCGNAPLYGIYRGFAKTVTCADWADSLHANRHLDLEIDLTQPLPIDDSSYDTVVLTDVLEHIPVPEAVAAEVARILRPGGKVLIGVPFMYGVHEAPYDYHRYTEFRLRGLCEGAGLVVDDLWSYGDGWHSLFDLAGKQLQSRVPKAFIRGLARVAFRHEPDRSSSIPSGYAVVARAV